MLSGSTREESGVQPAVMAYGDGFFTELNYLDNMRAATILATLMVVVSAVGRFSSTSRDVRHNWTRWIVAHGVTGSELVWGSTQPVAHTHLLAGLSAVL
jgi:hypothetical protein